MDFGVRSSIQWIAPHRGHLKLEKRRNTWTYATLKGPCKEWTTLPALGSRGCRATFLLGWRWRGGGIRICSAGAWGTRWGTRLRRGDSGGLRSRISARRRVRGVTGPGGLLIGETKGLWIGVVGRWGCRLSRCLSSSCSCASTNLFKDRTLKTSKTAISIWNTFYEYHKYFEDEYEFHPK